MSPVKLAQQTAKSAPTLIIVNNVMMISTLTAESVLPVAPLSPTARPAALKTPVPNVPTDSGSTLQPQEPVKHAETPTVLFALTVPHVIPVKLVSLPIPQSSVHHAAPLFLTVKNVAAQPCAPNAWPTPSSTPKTPAINAPPSSLTAKPVPPMPHALPVLQDSLSTEPKNAPLAHQPCPTVPPVPALPSVPHAVVLLT